MAVKKPHKTWFTSDWHMGHEKVIEFCNRPFEDVTQMDYQLTTRFNRLVAPTDLVYMLGDMNFHKPPLGIDLLWALNGQKILIQGNHDKWSKEQYRRAGFISILTQARLQIGKRSVILSHYPYLPKPGEEHEYEYRYPERRPDDKGDWLLCGHVHEKWKIRQRQINVGVDVWNFEPVPLSTVEGLISKEGT